MLSIVIFPMLDFAINKINYWTVTDNFCYHCKMIIVMGFVIMREIPFSKNRMGKLFQQALTGRRKSIHL